MHQQLALSPVIALLLVVGSSPFADEAALAQPATRFYEGKSLNLIISSATGGGYDALGRLVARHLVNHIPGNPTLVVHNMPGAGGLIAINHLFNVAPKDGTTFGLVQNSTPFSPLLGATQAKYEASKFNWLGSPNIETALLAVWHTVPVNSIADIRKREIAVASNGSDSTATFYPRLFNATLGTRMKVVYGYQSAAEAFLAMQRGELDGYPTIFKSSLMATHPTWVKEGLLKLLLQFGPQKDDSVGDVPFAADLMKTAEDKKLLEVGIANLAVGRPFAAPPGVPADRIAILRAAFAATFTDPRFIAEADSMKVDVSEPRSSVELARVIADAYAAPPAIIERLRILYDQQTK
jgi:tripartite-type tricarboxylate transporter receptor subunit TctC